jgi:hypothetical protein
MQNIILTAAWLKTIAAVKFAHLQFYLPITDQRALLAMCKYVQKPLVWQKITILICCNPRGKWPADRVFKCYQVFYDANYQQGHYSLVTKGKAE